MAQENPEGTLEQKPVYEELQVMGEQLLTRVRELLHEGNVRRIIIKQEDHTILEVPLTVGLVGVLALPQLAAIGAIAALLNQCSIEVVRVVKPTEAAQESVEEVLTPNEPTTI